MNSKDCTVTQEQLLHLLAEEKETYNNYVQLCNFYQISPDPMATAAHQAKIQTLNQLLGGKLPSTTLIRKMTNKR